MKMICEKCHFNKKCSHRKEHDHNDRCDSEHIDWGCMGKDRRGCHPVGCLMIENEKAL